MEKKNDIEIYSTRNEEKSVIAERFITSISKNIYNNTYYKTIKIKPTDIKPSIYIDYSKKN